MTEMGSVLEKKINCHKKLSHRVWTTLKNSYYFILYKMCLLNEKSYSSYYKQHTVSLSIKIHKNESASKKVNQILYLNFCQKKILFVHFKKDVKPS